MQLADEHPVDDRPGHAGPGHRRAGRRGLRRALGDPVPRGPRPQPLHRPDVHPAVPDAPPPGRDDEAQPAPRGRPRPAPDRRRRLDRPRHDDQADRRPAPQGRRGRGPRPDQRAADLPPLLLRDRHPDRDRAHRGDPVDRGDPRVHRRRFARLPVDRRGPGGARPAVRPVLLRLLRRQLPGARPVRRPEPQVHARGGARRRRPGRRSCCPARRGSGGPVADLRRAYVRCGRRRRRRRADGRAHPRGGRVDPTARGRRRARRLRRGGRAAGRAARSGPRQRDRRRRARRPRSPPRSTGSTRSGSTSSRCAPTTSSAAAPRRSSSSTTSPSAGSTRSPSSELVGGIAAGCREAGCALVGGETAEHPGIMDDGRVRPRRVLRRRRRAGPDASTDRRSGRATRSSAWPRPGSTRTASRSSGRSSPSTTSTCARPTRSGSAGRSATPRPTPSSAPSRGSRWPPSARSC